MLSSAAALLDGLFEHPANHSCTSTTPTIRVAFGHKLEGLHSLRERERPKRGRLLLMGFELGDRQIVLRSAFRTADPQRILKHIHLPNR